MTTAFDKATEHFGGRLVFETVGFPSTFTFHHRGRWRSAKLDGKPLRHLYADKAWRLIRLSIAEQIVSQWQAETRERAA